MKDCLRYAPMIGAREGELEAAERAGLAAHLDGCAACRARAADLAAALGSSSELAVYPPAPARSKTTWRGIVKGAGNLPQVLGEVLRGWRKTGRQTRDIMDVEMDPVEWQS